MKPTRLAKVILHVILLSTNIIIAEPPGGGVDARCVCICFSSLFISLRLSLLVVCPNSKDLRSTSSPNVLDVEPEESVLGCKRKGPRGIITRRIDGKLVHGKYVGQGTVIEAAGDDTLRAGGWIVGDIEFPAIEC